MHWSSRMDITLYSIHCSSSYDAILVIKWCWLDEILIWRHHNDHIFNHNSTSFVDIINRIIALVTSYSTGQGAIFTDSYFPFQCLVIVLALRENDFCHIDNVLIPFCKHLIYLAFNMHVLVTWIPKYENNTTHTFTTNVGKPGVPFLWLLF